MFNFDKSDVQRLVVSSVGAIALSATCIFAAVGPVKAATPNAPLTVTEWQSRVADRVETMQEGRMAYQPAGLTTAEVAVRFTADGDFAGASIARSSGNRQVDNRAVYVARRVNYPALPQGLRGAPATIHMVLYFGTGADAATEYAITQDHAKNIQYASAGTGDGMQVAAR